MVGCSLRLNSWLIVVALICALATSIRAEDRVLGAKLEKIRVEVSTVEREIERLRSEFSVLVKQRRDLETSIVKLKEDDRRLTKKIAVLAKESEKQQEKVQLAEARLAVEHAKIQGRLRALYVSSAPAMSPFFVWKAQGPELERFAVYIRAVRAKDQGKFQVIKQVVEELVEHRRKLREAIDEGKRLQEDVAVKRVDREQKVVVVRELTDQIAAKQRAAQKSLLRLRTESERLESLLSSITGGGAQEDQKQQEESSQQDSAAASLGAGSSSVPERRELDASRASMSLAPQGLFSQGIALASPVSGKVLQRFGKVKVADFSDMIFSKGLEFAAPKGTTVHAITNGKVAYVGSMPAYETVVVVDHGARSYSLYGRLGSAVVKKGDVVERDAVLGTTAELDKKGRNFYFEVRRNGSPVDPETVLKRVSR